MMALPPAAAELACRSCGLCGLEVVFSLGEQPLANALLTDEDLHRPEPVYPLDLAFCTGCSLAQITVSVPPEELFAEYAYFSSFSPTVVSNAESLVARLVRERGLGDQDLAMEIASNDGYLLRHYRRAGVAVKGIDPARNVAAMAEVNGVPTVTSFFGLELAERLRADGIRPSVVHANNVIAHVPDPNGVVAGIARVLRNDGIAIIETPYVRELVEKLEFDTIYHEHLFYYSLTSLSALLGRNGLEVIDVELIPIHGGSLRVTSALRHRAPVSQNVKLLLEEERKAGVNEVSFYQGFADRVQAVCDSLRQLLLELKAKGHRLAGYGAAAKAAVLLNTAAIGADVIDFVADRSPHKQGRYLPGVHIAVVPAEQLVADMPDEVVIFAWNFAEEVMAQQAEYRARGGRFVIPIPEPRFA